MLPSTTIVKGFFFVGRYRSSGFSLEKLLTGIFISMSQNVSLNLIVKIRGDRARNLCQHDQMAGNSNQLKGNMNFYFKFYFLVLQLLLSNSQTFRNIFNYDKCSPKNPQISCLQEFSGKKRHQKNLLSDRNDQEQNGCCWAAGQNCA